MSHSFKYLKITHEKKERGVKQSLANNVKIKQLAKLDTLINRAGETSLAMTLPRQQAGKQVAAVNELHSTVP